MTNPPTDERGVTDAMVEAAKSGWMDVIGRYGVNRTSFDQRMRAALEAALSHQGDVVKSENERIGAFVRRVEREGASNLHQSMAQAFVTHALSGEHDEAG